MNTEDITEKEQALELYCSKLENLCRRLDSEPDRKIEGLPWVTRNGLQYEPKPEIRRDW